MWLLKKLSCLVLFFFFFNLWSVPGKSSPDFSKCPLLTTFCSWDPHQMNHMAFRAAFYDQLPFRDFPNLVLFTFEPNYWEFCVSFSFLTFLISNLLVEWSSYEPSLELECWLCHVQAWSSWASLSTCLCFRFPFYKRVIVPITSGGVITFVNTLPCVKSSRQCLSHCENYLSVA